MRYWAVFAMMLSGVLMVAGLIFEATKEPGIPTYMVPHIEDQIDYTMTGHAAGESIGGSALDVVRIEEDDPRWDCRTMGNRICGKV